jgi:beta-N-acetylhexosaminidase
MSPIKAFICGLAGDKITDPERDFLTKHQPYGVILFARNCKNPAQVKALCADIKSCLTQPNPHILIDQEGGRVARLKPPHWRAYPPAKYFADMPNQAEAAALTALNAQILGDELRAHGITMDCAPVADILHADCHDIIGDRAFGVDAAQVAHLALAQAEGLLRAGILPIIKHIPGHGRAKADSHLELPVVDAPLKTLEKTDFQAFKTLRHLPIAMSAHIIFTALDAALPATISPIVMRYIRDEIGFDGLIMSDDISMKALQGSLASLTEKILAAGCDLVLHCNGNMDEMHEIATHCPLMDKQALARADAAQRALSGRFKPVDVADLAQWQSRIGTLAA